MRAGNALRSRFRRPVKKGTDFTTLFPAYRAKPENVAGGRRRLAHACADLALQLDSLTNNTSLALAIERIADGRVLLFPADAQQGNWLSWHKLEWQRERRRRGGRPATVTAADLLDRTVFYKVGHHGSHNATAKRRGWN